MFGDTVTLFCRKDSLWYPTVLKKVNLNMDRAAIIQAYGETSTDTCILNVHLPAEKPYLDPKSWQASDPAANITFTTGQKFDFFWAGEWDGDSPVSDDGYGMLTFYDWMNKNYDNVFAVTGVSSFSVIPHLEVTGQ